MTAFLVVFIGRRVATWRCLPHGGCPPCRFGRRIQRGRDRSDGQRLRLPQRHRVARRLGWRTNPLFLWAVGAELVAVGAFILIPSRSPTGSNSSMPPLAGLAVALATAPAVLAADAAHKAWHRTKSHSSRDQGPDAEDLCHYRPA